MKTLAFAVLLATLPASPNPISAGNVQTEYGGSAPVSFSEYYRGGAYVVAGANINIPTSGAISLHNFHGTTKPSSALSASVDDVGPYGECNYTAPGSCAAVSTWVTCSGSGGTPAYSYSWAYVSGHNDLAIFPDSTSQAAYWEHTASNLSVSAVWRCTVTDSMSATATVDVTVILASLPI